MAMTGWGLRLWESPIVGRDEEVRFLHERVRAASRGRPGVLLLDGGAGAGKTRLVFDAMVVAGVLGMGVALASTDEPTHLGPLGALVGAIGVAARAPASDSLRPVLTLLPFVFDPPAAGAPIVVAADGLEAADRATLQALRDVPAQLESHAVLWLLAGNRGHPGTAIDNLFLQLEDVGADRVRLGPLRADAVETLIRDMTGAPPDRDLLSIAAGAGGNPGLVVDLVAGLLEEGAVDASSGISRLMTDRLPRRVEANVAFRLGRLSRDAARLVEVASVIAASFSMKELSDVLGVTPGGLLGALDEAIGAGFLIGAAGALAFREDLVRRAVYEHMPEAVRTALHHQVGGPTVGDRASPTRDRLALLDLAALELSTLLPGSAADVAVRALTMTPAADEHRFQRSVTAVDALVGAKRFSAASDLAGAELVGTQLPMRAAAHLHVVRSELLLLAGRPSDSARDADAAAEMLDAPDELCAAAEAARLIALVASGDFRDARERADGLLGGVSGEGGSAPLVAALTTHAALSWREGRVADALGMARAAVQRSEPVSTGSSAISAVSTLVALLGTTGEFEEADELIRRTRAEAGSDGSWGSFLLYAAARVHLAAGRLRDAAEEANATLAVAADTGVALLTPLAHWILASAALLSGDLDSAERHVQHYRVADPAVEKQYYSAPLDFTAGWIATARGDMEQAEAFFEPMYDNPPDHRLLLAAEPTAAAFLVRHAVRHSDGRRADGVVVEAELVAAASPSVGSLSAAAAHARGLADQNAAMLDDAAARHRHPWARASALEDSGVVLSTSDSPEARVRFQQALEGYDRIGARRGAERVRRRLARLGRGGPQAGGKPVEGWSSLTETERQVAALVAQGLTNPQVADRMTLSRHTVGSHLRQIFRKLNINSRVELTRIILEREGE